MGRTGFYVKARRRIATTLRNVAFAVYPETFSCHARWRNMADEPGTLRARLDKLAALVEMARLSRSAEDRARMERSIQLISWALQAVARARRLDGDTARQCEAAEVEALCRRIVMEARAVGLHIGDNDNWK